jgi:'Cold-shock' DNA-binding domain
VTAARQLHLFRGRKQCGIAPPVASEYQLHCAVADTVRRWIMPGWIYTHIASGEKRNAVTAARLKRSGGKDVFVHISAVEKAGLNSLNEGAKVSYEEMSNRGKTSAEI